MSNGEQGSRARMWKMGGGVAGLAVIFVIIVAVNVLVAGVRLRADLTEEKLYTLSEGTQKILKNLDQDVEIKFYASTSLPEVPIFLKDYADRVWDLLQEYRLVARGHLTLTREDPKPDSDAEEWAQKYGITGQALDVFGPPFYLGLVAICGKDEAVIPVLDPRMEALLEYQITRLIWRVTHPTRPVIGVLSSLPVLGSQSPPFMMPGQPPQRQAPWLVFQELRQDYELRQLEGDMERIPDDLQTLLVIHPKNLSDRTLFAIDQFVLRGGHLVVLVDPLCFADSESGQSGMFGWDMSGSNLEKLFQAWGVAYAPDRVVADSRAGLPLPTGDGKAELNFAWILLGTNGMNRSEVLTSQIDWMIFPAAGCFRNETGSDLQFIPLLKTSEASGLVSPMAARFGGVSMRREFKSEGAPLTLAVRLTGQFKTAFPEGPPSLSSTTNAEDRTESPTNAPSAFLREGESSVVLVGDVDFVNDRFCYEELNFFGAKVYRPLMYGQREIENGAFFANVVEQMAGSPDLIAIRARGRSHRPFDRVLAIEQRAVEAWRAQEAELERELEETQRQLREMQAGKEGHQRFILSEEQKQAIVRFRARELEIKARLKEVRKNLRRDIERLGVTVKVVNMALMPLLVALSGVGIGIYRRFKV